MCIFFRLHVYKDCVHARMCVEKRLEKVSASFELHFQIFSYVQTVRTLSRDYFHGE